MARTFGIQKIELSRNMIAVALEGVHGVQRIVFHGKSAVPESEHTTRVGVHAASALATLDGIHSDRIRRRISRVDIPDARKESDRHCRH